MRKQTPRPLQTLEVRRAARLSGESGPMGHVKAGALTLACALGRAGPARHKREGDGATPVGAMDVLYGYFRPDRMSRPFCRVPLRPSHRDLGWCDDPRSPSYNRPGALPMRAGHEEMWRSDGLYDVVFVLDYNLHPRRAGRGSAIFLHCAKSAAGSDGSRLKPTLGCVALKPGDMRRLLPRLGRRPRLIVF
jgi:L,D-peptidoglycan transpeptidase YkuD (ErfK/YbiS/YcfS/YnhG family)